jgi:hypothetical protein
MLDYYEVLRTNSFHDNFKNFLSLGHDGLKLITTINLFYVCHVFLSLGCNKSNDLAMLRVGLAWFLRHLVQNFGWVFNLFSPFCVGSSTSSFGCEKPAKKNIPSICVKLEKPSYVILKWNV